MKTETTFPAASDYSDASAVSAYSGSWDSERAAAAHVIAAYELRTVCELDDCQSVQAAGKRLRLW